MCCNQNQTQNENGNCIAEILTVISILQKNASCSDTCLDSCDRGFLGCGTSTIGCNTRPVMIFTCCGNGTPWSMPISKNPFETETSSIFRVEKIDENCATFRVLTTNQDTEETSIPFVSTNSFFTMNLDCVCALRCLNDTFVECL